MNVLLSIKPKYAGAILDGEKEYEFRKAIFRDKNVEKVYDYSSSPASLEWGAPARVPLPK